MNLSPNRIDRLRHTAEVGLLAAEVTFSTLNDLRQHVQPNRYESDGP